MLAMQSLRELGFTADRAREIAAIFERHEYFSIRDLASFEGKEGYFRRAREQIEILERAVSALPAIPAPRTRDEEKRDENALEL
jgi:hypothetical protein